ncbi:MAG TPA: hypothetical protein VE782_06755 [Myxococcaceae bacterium]|nr:hypothetical protein [Myxococcaceae bacterium]
MFLFAPRAAFAELPADAPVLEIKSDEQIRARISVLNQQIDAAPLGRPALANVGATVGFGLAGLSVVGGLGYLAITAIAEATMSMLIGFAGGSHYSGPGPDRTVLGLCFGGTLIGVGTGIAAIAWGDEMSRKRNQARQALLVERRDLELRLNSPSVPSLEPGEAQGGAGRTTQNVSAP